ncbi:hypothetical protein [Spirosoma gilvum]
MDKCLFLSLAVLATLQLSCTSRVDNSVQPTETPDSQSMTMSARSSADPLVPDSIAAYRPTFGNASTVRQFPYSATNQPGIGIRLTKVLYNGRPIRTYAYNEQGRLTDRTDYYTDGTHIYKTFSYTYQAGKPVNIVSQLNKEANSTTSYPRNNELRPSTQTTLTDSAGWIRKTTTVEFLDGYQKPGTSISRLGFSPAGTLIWEEKLDTKGAVNQYTLYHRNESGNVALRRTGLLNNRWETLRYRYDNNPNPFRTTGDIQSLDFGDLSGFDLTAINNATSVSSVNSEKGNIQWRYTYEYRPDGYPSRATIYRDERMTSTIEFIYNQ